MKRKNTSAQLLDNQLTNIYPNYKKFLDKHLKAKKFVIGVSGGSDSLALVYLSKLYSQERKVKFEGIIVDHGVRKGSDKEAKKVKQILLKNKVKSHIFKIKFNNIKNFHSEARKKRYEKIISFCKKNRVKNILLGHHLDDQIENFYIRLSRGSGLTGLSPIKKVSNFKNLYFLRPLLNIKKQDLIKISKKYFNFYVKDPSNFDNKYLRSRVRKLRSFMEREGFGDQRLLSTLNNLNKASEALEFYSNSATKKFIIKKSNSILISKKLFKEPYEVIFRSISNFFTNNKDYPPRAKGIDRLITDLSNKNSKNVTLGGYIFENGLNSVKVKKENRKR